MKNVFGSISLSDLCASALSQLEGHDLEKVAVDEKAILEEKAREELYSRLKQQLASFGASQPAAEAIAAATEAVNEKHLAAKAALALEAEKKAVTAKPSQPFKIGEHDQFLKSLAAFGQQQKQEAAAKGSLNQIRDSAAELEAFR